MDSEVMNSIMSDHLQSIATQYNRKTMVVNRVLNFHDPYMERTLFYLNGCVLIN